MGDTRRRGKSINQTFWAFLGANVAAQSAGSQAITFLAAQDLPRTLMRLRGEFLAIFDAAPDVGDQVTVGAGLILVPEGTSTTVLWSPVTDGSAPWIWVDYITLIYEEFNTNVDASQVGAGARRIIDGKAMRRMRNQELQLVVENQTNGTAQATNTSVNTRILLGS